MLFLASKSPQRSALLRARGIAFTLVNQDAPEDDVEGTPEQIVLTLARRKARSALSGLTDGLVLGADTLVAIDDEVLGKPIDECEAARMLTRLSGRVHEVFTGLYLLNVRTGEALKNVVRTAVTFYDLSPDMISAYVKTGDPMSRAGAYGIQGEAGKFVRSIDGSYENVVGLPVDEVIEMLDILGG